MAQAHTLHLDAVPQASTAEIRPFRVNFPEEQLADLRRRIAATQWPERETVNDATQGVQLVTMQELARYWVTDYDWRKCEARLNALPQFITTIDGLDIHFIHVRSKNKNALPIIITHGWPGSIIEQLKVIGPLTDPVGSGRRLGQCRYGVHGRAGAARVTRDPYQHAGNGSGQRLKGARVPTGSACRPHA